MQPITNNTWLWVRVGGLRGLIAGTILALLYVIIPPLLAVAFIATVAFLEVTGMTEPSASSTGMFQGVGVAALIYTVVGFVIGVLPATLIGSVSGAVLGAMLSHRAIAPSRWKRIMVGIGLAVAIIGLLSSLLLPYFGNGGDARFAYFFFIGIPSIPYLLTCIYLSNRLPRWIEQEEHVIEVPVGETPYLPT